ELDDLGLGAALRSLCDEFLDRTRIATELSLTSLPRQLPGEVELNVYRIVQEALNNVERHSRASRVRVVLRRKGCSLIASIRDNGRGFDPTRPGKAPGMGLLDMRERTTLL